MINLQMLQNVLKKKKVKTMRFHMHLLPWERSEVGDMLLGRV